MRGAVCSFAGVGLLVVLLIGALILRMAVAAVNRFAGPQRPKAEGGPLYADWDWDGEEEDERSLRGGTKAVPEPSVGRAMAVTGTAGVLTTVFGVLTAVLLETVADDPFDRDEEGQIVALAVLTLPLSCFGATLLFMAMLPTTFLRAAAVAFVHHALSVGLVVIVGGAIALLLR